jgi:nitroimidazol reductase NimA-like FMN-containing flavoprotein (pyridoxamine 5'-phosphate oxidase superfamily)
MVVHEITEQECRELLARTHIARLACVRHNQPYVVPIHIDFHRDYL